MALGRDGKAFGSLYLGEVDSTQQPTTSLTDFSSDNDVLAASGKFDYLAEDKRAVIVTVLDQQSRPGTRVDHELGRTAIGRATAPANMRRDGTSVVIIIGDSKAAAAVCLSILEQKHDGDVTVIF